MYSRRERLQARAVEMASRLSAAGHVKVKEMWQRHRKEASPQAELAVDAASAVHDASSRCNSPSALDSVGDCLLSAIVQRVFFQALLTSPERRTPASEVTVVDRRKRNMLAKKRADARFT